MRDSPPAFDVEPPAAATSRSDPLDLDVRRIRALLQAPLPPLDLRRIPEPEAEVGCNAALRARAARVHLKRFFVACARGLPLLADRELVASVASIVRSFAGLDVVSAQGAALRPEFTSWAWFAAEAGRRGDGALFATLCLHLGGVALSTLTRAGALPEGEALILPRSTERTLQLLGPGRMLVSDAPLPERLRVIRRGSAVRFTGATGGEFEVALADLGAPGRSCVADRGVSVADLPAVPGGPVLLRRDAWYERFFPTDPRARAGQLYVEIGDAEFALFQRCMVEGCVMLAEHWPEAWRELAESISVVMPLRTHGLVPRNASVHTFRGLITSSARPGYLAAQSLAHEAGHNKFSSVLDCCILYENSEDELYHSLFVDAPRPLSALLHGVISFLQDILVSRRVLGRVPEIEGAPLARYLEKITARVVQSMQTIRAHARLTAAGEGMVQGCEEALRA